MASRPAYPVGRTWALAAVALVLAAAAFVLAFSEARSVVAAAGAGQLVALWAGAVGGFPLAAMFVAVALLCVLSLRADRAEPVAKPLFAIILATFALTFVAPWAARAMIGDHLAHVGYVRCPAIYERPITRVRWARPPTPCPTGRT